MPQLRNLLGRKPAVSDGDNSDVIENVQSRLSVDSQHSGPMNFRKSREEVPNEYKLSVVNDSGVYLPPSPPEKQSFWHKYSHSPASSNHRNLVNENEPFSISRESFDSYRRSFDISARSPVPQSENIPPRTSLDSRFPRHNGRSRGSFEQPQSMEEETFEDVRLADEDIKPKKRGLFARFGDNSTEATSSNNRPPSSHLGFRLPGRKRGQSGQGAELGDFKPESPTAEV
ncbi:hypothetical protein BGW36DRAFT_35758 [Talaromyces proteolyticus]|uniref:Uncharacterized protein n=1 Tax=Talaromyces proteolyticus TaxID=1131652 RepID=A0AAD4KIR7_9EURO|nr:uncharacterized protein BGW36DRAFT_35758 [Talaromyces proteolyticus]KAH8693173.1 hypothetical protein BGW36DRAFT_35758 [Talaromyces proteolyticus]